jgi:hypothetical protein
MGVGVVFGERIEFRWAEQVFYARQFHFLGWAV